jgi:tRNA (cytidine/uridine-2'-O-)-methyltransferase
MPCQLPERTIVTPPPKPPSDDSAHDSAGPPPAALPPQGLRLALYQPDIPQNCGTLLRLAACLGVAVDILEPCGFVLSDARLKRAGMDYLGQADMRRHSSWEAFRRLQAPSGRRLILLTTKGETAYPAFAFRADDILMVGRESAGVPADVAAAADARLVIPLKPGLRSLNVAVAASMVLGEALRQTGTFPAP